MSSSPRCRVVATAGHVDHGKSTLVRVLTGVDPDRWAEEKARGLTIDLGFASTTLPSGTELSFVDVPGHVRFLPNMLAGVGGVAACLFVVAATEGWKPQSEEHLRILELLGAGHGLVALTKIDLLDRDEIELAHLELGEALEGTFLAGAPVVEVAAEMGRGVETLRSALDSMLAAVGDPDDAGRPRLWVDRSFTAPGAGTVVTGTLTGGSLRLGDRASVMPGGSQGRIRGLQTHGRTVEEAGPGRRVAVNLAGVDADAVGRGQAIVEPGRWLATRIFDAGLRALDGLGHPLTRRGAYSLHTGTWSGPATVQVLGGRSLLEPGESAAVRVRLNEDLPLIPGDRFVLREWGRDETVGGGEVLDVAPVRRPGRAQPDRDPGRVLRERGWVEAEVFEQLTGVKRAPEVGRWVVDPDARVAAEARLRDQVGAAGEAGVELASLGAFERALLSTMGDLEAAGERVRPAGAAIDPATSAWLDALQGQPFAPPAPDGIDRSTLRDLVREGTVVEADGLYFHRTAVDAAARTVAGLLADSPDGVTASAVREALGTSRKWALPLLGHLDASGVTRRRGDLRVGGPRLPAA